MVTRKVWLSIAALALLGQAFGEDAVRFRFRPGESWQYRVQQTTRVTQTFQGETNLLESSTELVKRWEVKEVLPDGSAWLQLSIPELKLKQKLPSGQSIVYDSTQPQQSHAALREQMEQFVGKPTVQLKVDSRGQVLETKPLLPIPGIGTGSEPPFGIVLPESALQAGQRWQRSFQIVLEPPLGTGQKYDAEQHYEVRTLAAEQAEITFVTQLKNPPTDPAEKIPLLQKITRGVAVLDRMTGRVTLLRVQAGGTVEGLEGAPDSKYEFFSEYVERLQR
jgi:hypothetical protein